MLSYSSIKVLAKKINNLWNSKRQCKQKQVNAYSIWKYCYYNWKNPNDTLEEKAIEQYYKKLERYNNEKND